ncbi:MAG: PepSY domain-containing protein [Pseudomonadota bacterium]
MEMPCFDRRRLLVAIAALVGASALASADAERDDHERARRAVVEGKARPLSEILAALAPSLDGEVIEVELESKSGRLVYELKVLSVGGRVREIYVDAATAEIVSTKAK